MSLGSARIVSGPIISPAERRFWEFHDANPAVYEFFQKFACEVLAAGRRRYSADAIFHRIRWHVNIETRSRDDLKLNDHYTAFYARLFARDFPQHAGFFATRTQRTPSTIEGRREPCQM